MTDIEHGHDEHQAMIDSEWHRLQGAYAPVYEMGFDRYAAGHTESVARAFTLGDKTARCIDEGTPGGLHLAGTGILLPEQEAVRILTAMGVDGVTSHSGCGAAGMAARAQGYSGDVEQFAQQWAQQMASLTGVPYRGHIPMSDMRRPHDFHNAIAAYVDTTGSFDYAQAPELPPGFVISRGLIPPEVAAAETRVAVDIAFGGHGLGKGRFTQEHPFMLVHVADPRRPMPEVQRELQEIQAAYGPHVSVQTLTRPV